MCRHEGGLGAPEVTCRMRRAFSSIAKQLRIPVAKAPVSMLMRWERISGAATGVWPCTTTLSNGGIVIGRVLADPQKIAFRLLGQGNPRARACMTEKEIADREADLQALQEQEMGQGQPRRQRIAKAAETGPARRLGKSRAIGKQGHHAAEVHPARSELFRSIDETQEHLLMIALEPGEGAPVDRP